MAAGPARAGLMRPAPHDSAPHCRPFCCPTADAAAPPSPDAQVRLMGWGGVGWGNLSFEKRASDLERVCSGEGEGKWSAVASPTAGKRP